jgi:ABC-type sugar transport system permease subunit
MKRDKTPYLFLFPGVIFVFTILLSPSIYGVWQSFYESYKAEYKFVGFKNYEALLKDERFFTNIKLSLTYLLVIPPSIALGYLIAILLTSNLKGIKFFKTIVILPFASASVATAYMFRSIVNPVFGPLTIFNDITGLSINPFSDATLAMIVIILHSIWRSVPFYALFLAAAIESIPSQIFEQSKIDGAGAWSRFKNITLPLTLPHMLIATLMVMTWTLGDMEASYSLFFGGPGRGTEVIAIRLAREAFFYGNIGLGSAIAIFLIVPCMIFLIIYLKLLRRIG